MILKVRVTDRPSTVSSWSSVVAFEREGNRQGRDSIHTIEKFDSLRSMVEGG